HDTSLRGRLRIGVMLEAAFASAVGNALGIVVTFMIDGEALLLVDIVKIRLKNVAFVELVHLKLNGKRRHIPLLVD
ncbi:hypothetical protein ACC676_39835, partial [Rhizobium ruizarguesonis]